MMDSATRTESAGAAVRADPAGEREVFDQLKPLIMEVTGAKEDEIGMDSVLMSDLGAESLDLLDLSFLIEERFGITIEADEFESRARQRLEGGEYERNGCLTEAALAELREALPEVAPDKLAPGLRKSELPSVLPVSVFVHLVQRKVAAKSEGDARVGEDA